MITVKKLLIPVFLFAAAAALAQEGTSLESDWLELVKGHKGKTLGLELREIEDGGSAGSRTVTIAIPKTAIEHPDTIEEVVVIGRKPDDPEPLDIQYEWLDDYDNDNYGLVIHLGNVKWPIRLYMNSSPGFTQ